MEWPCHRVPILVNEYEWAVDGQLGRLCERYGARLFEKVGVKDVVPIREGRLDPADRDYGFKAHFDFVITDEDAEALLAVEFDGPRHLTDPQQIIRDNRKNRICEEFMLPLVRAGASALRRVDHRTLLEWLIEVFFEQRRLWQQQYAYEGEEEVEPPECDPYDFDYRKSFKPALRGLRVWSPLDPFGEARAEIARFYWVSPGEHPEYKGWVEKDPRGHTVGHLALRVSDDGWLVGTGRCDMRGIWVWLDAVFPPAFAQDLALLGLARDLDAWQHGRIKPISTVALNRLVANAETQAWGLLPMPNGMEQTEVILRTWKSWGIDVDDPLVLADALGSVPGDDELDADYCERMNREHAREEALELARDFDREFGTDTTRLMR